MTKKQYSHNKNQGFPELKRFSPQIKTITGVLSRIYINKFITIYFIVKLKIIDFLKSSEEKRRYIHRYENQMDSRCL